MPRRLPTVHRLARATCALSVGVLAAVATAQDAPGLRNWHMDRGNAARSSAVLCDPIRSRPELAWRFAPEAGVQGRPVVWDGVVFALTTDEKGRAVLVALDARTGTERARVTLRRTAEPDARLLVWQGTVVVLDRSGCEAVLFTGDSLRSRWSREDGRPSSAVVTHGLLFVSGSSGARAVDLARGRDVDLTVPGAAAVAAGSRQDGSVLLGSADVGDRSGYLGTWLRLYVSRLVDPAGRKPTLQAGRAAPMAAFVEGAQPRAAERAEVHDRAPRPVQVAQRRQVPLHVVRVGCRPGE